MKAQTIEKRHYITLKKRAGNEGVNDNDYQLIVYINL